MLVVYLGCDSIGEFDENLDINKFIDDGGNSLLLKEVVVSIMLFIVMFFVFDVLKEWSLRKKFLINGEVIGVIFKVEGKFSFVS